MIVGSQFSQLNLFYKSDHQESGSIDNFVQRGRIVLFMDQRIVKNIPPEESQLHFLFRRALQVGVVVGGFVGRLPFIQMNLDLGGENKVYGGALAVGSCISFGYLISYAFLEMIDSQLGPLYEEEKGFVEGRFSPTLKKIFFSVSTILGFGAQIPFAYIAFQHNPPSAFNPKKLTMSIMVLMLDSSITTYSPYKGLECLKKQELLTNQESKLVGLREKICGFIQTNLELFTSLDQDFRKAFLISYNIIQTTRIDEGHRVGAIYELFTQHVAEQNRDSFKCDECLDFLVKTCAYICSACNIGTLGYVAWQGTDALMGNIYANVGFTGLYVRIALYLNVKAIPETAVSLFRSFRNLLTCRYQSTLASQLTPKLTLFLNSLVLTSAALSYGPAIQLSEDYYGFEECLKMFMEIVLSLGVTKKEK